LEKIKKKKQKLFYLFSNLINYKQSKFDCALTTMAASASASESASATGFSDGFAALLQKGAPLDFAAALKQGAPPKFTAALKQRAPSEEETLKSALQALEKSFTETKCYWDTPSGPFTHIWEIPEELRNSKDFVEILESIAHTLIKLGYKQKLTYYVGTKAGFFCFVCNDSKHQCNRWCIKELDPCSVSFIDLKSCRRLELCSAKKFSAE
jgi:hypothetical protein